MTFLTYPDRDVLVMDVAQQLVEDLADVLDHQERVRLAVCGGTTPGPVFDLLSVARLDWARVDVVLTDERWVPPTDSRSNAQLVTSRLLTGVAAAAQFHPLYRDVQQPEEALTDIEAAVAPLMPLDIVLLGMGADMHTASLFPGADGLEAALAADAPTVVSMRPEDMPEARVSLSAPALNAVKGRHLLITGDAKRAALSKAQDLPAIEAPIKAILDDTLIHWAA